MNWDSSTAYKDIFTCVNVLEYSFELHSLMWMVWAPYVTHSTSHGCSDMFHVSHLAHVKFWNNCQIFPTRIISEFDNRIMLITGWVKLEGREQNSGGEKGGGISFKKWKYHKYYSEIILHSKLWLCPMHRSVTLQL